MGICAHSNAILKNTKLIILNKYKSYNGFLIMFKPIDTYRSHMYVFFYLLKYLRR